MAPRRGASQSSLAPQDPNVAPSTQPRSTSPSSGFTQFLTKPTKWFTRTASGSKLSASASDPKLAASGARKHKISRPTDPRPILDNIYAGGGTRSVLDLSARGEASIDIPRFHTPSTPSSPSRPGYPGLGDLRNVSQKAWSRSADDLSKAPAQFSPIHASFQEKVANYRNRSNSSASAVSASPSSSTAVLNGRHPFPTSAATPPSSPPPRSATLPSVSISFSTPPRDEEQVPLSTSPTHFHQRSHSFTPKQPSKLANNTRLPPPSPNKPEPQQGTPPRAGYGFGFGAASSPANDRRTTTLLPPPMIVEPNQEPEEGDPTDLKRSSQIVFRTGFLNRFTDNFSQSNPSLSKGWKPFKAELKGSKLFFYKPPGEKANGIKNLFPTGLVPPSAEEDYESGTENLLALPDDENGYGRSRKESSGGPGRKKRAYWGRKTHPDLILDAAASIEKGTFESLIHESVFATTFQLSEEPNHPLKAQATKKWHELATSVLFCIPVVVGRQIFEAEFLRCCSYLVSGAEDSVREESKSRVAWLANEYLRYYGQPFDAPGWEDWKRDTLPDVNLSAEGCRYMPSISLSASSQAIFHPSPAIGSSPNLNTFSPRPENGNKMISLQDALFPPIYPDVKAYQLQQQSTRSGLAPPSNRYPWSALKEEGLTRDVLLYLDPYLVARSLTLFHRSVLDECPDNLTAEFIINTDPQHSASNSSDALFGSDEKPHWLTKLLLMQILGADSSSSGYPHALPPNVMSSPGRRSEDRSHTSRTHTRSELISIWAKIGELCRTGGDQCSWNAIAAALCSRAVARLDKAWKRVDPQALTAIEMWANYLKDGQTPPLLQPQVTPWGGDVKIRVNDKLAATRSENADSMIVVAHAVKARSLFDSFRASFLICPRKTYVSEQDVSEELRKLVSFWRDMAAEGGGVSGMALKFQRIEQFMSLSLAAEPRRKGLYEPYFWTRSSSLQTPLSSLVPLLFPDPLPSLTLIDRTKLVRGRFDSETADMHLRGLEPPQAPGRQFHGLDINVNQEFTKNLILGHPGTVISVYQGELLLVVQSGGYESAPSSRPPSLTASRTSSSHDGLGIEKTVSRNPSIRVKPGSSHGLDRKTSVARRSSLPSVSVLNKPTTFVAIEPSSDPPLRVIIQAGTLTTLVRVLVHGLDNISVSVADDNGEMSLRGEGKTRNVVIDRVEFARVWWNVFRSFMTPLVFFELLRKNYISAQPPGSPASIADYLRVADQRDEVLITIKEWLTLGGGAQDILDIVPLFDIVQAFFDDPLDIDFFKSSTAEAQPIKKAWESLLETKRLVKATYLSQTMRPTISRGLHNQRPQGRSIRNRNESTRDPPDLDRINPESFVENVDAMASAAFSNVTQEDLYITADLLEVQTADRTGWIPSRDAPSTEEIVEVQTIYSHIQEIEPSSLISELSQEALYRLLPPGVRSCIRAYGIIRKWLISRIVAPRIGLRARQARMELLLQAIAISRSRNSEFPSTTLMMEQPCVRSFVEAVTTSALLSVESRLHSKAWQAVALNRGASSDSLLSFLMRPFATSRFGEPLTVDMGWILERMLEIIASPDFVEASSWESQNLVNFDKRRHLCNLISKAHSLPSAPKHPLSEESMRRGFERLHNIEKEVLMLQFDHRGIKEEAAREALTLGVNPLTSNKKSFRPFNRVLAIQIEKNRRDKTLRTRLQREKLQEQTKNDRRDDFLNKAMRPRKQLSISQKQHRSKKSMSAFLSFMRPISSAFVSDSPQNLSVKRTPSQLDFAVNGKPSLVLSVLDAEISQFANNERSYTFKLDTEDGGHYLLQAMNKREMNRWLETISRVTKTAAQRRLTYLGNSPKPQIADHIHSHPIVPSRDPKAVFGVELDFLLKREAGSDYIPPGSVPTIIQQCLSVVETRGLGEVGIYRIAGASTEINSLKDAYNRGEFPIQETTDIHAICDLVKSWFRVLPEPVFPASSYHEMMDAMRESNLDDRLLRIRNVVQCLPQPNFDILKRVSEHLDRVTDYEEQNHMTAEALAIVFSPNLLRAPQNDFAMILNNMGHSHKLVKALITHFHVIFDEADAEGEPHSEDELESPIMEEAEEDEPTYEPTPNRHDIFEDGKYINHFNTPQQYP